MKTDAQRIAHYNARMLSSLIDPTLSAMQTAAVANYSAYVTDFYPYQQDLRVMLNALGIPTTTYFLYEAFNGEMYHVSKVATGASAVVMGGAIVAKYTTMGGAAATLKSIAVSLYNIIVP